MLIFFYEMMKRRNESGKAYELSVRTWSEIANDFPGEVDISDPSSPRITAGSSFVHEMTKQFCGKRISTLLFLRNTPNRDTVKINRTGSSGVWSVDRYSFCGISGLL